MEIDAEDSEQTINARKPTTEKLFHITNVHFFDDLCY